MQRESARVGSSRPLEPGWQDGWFFVPHEVTWRDLDAIGHVNNAVYFTYFEWARTKYWLEMVRSQDPHDITFIVARAECDFRQQLGLAEQIRIGVRIGDMRTSSFDFMYEIQRENGEVAATGKVVVVHFSWATNSKQSIPDELRRKIKTFQGESDSLLS